MRRCPVVIPILLLAGCVAPAPETAQRDAPVIELVAFPSCPNTPALRHNLRVAMRSAGRGLIIRDINQDALPPTDPRRRWPSPTVLVDGADLFGMPVPGSQDPGCRVYPDGVPDAAAIAARLRDLARN